MPELPEVETMVRGVRDAVLGRQIRSVHRPKIKARPIALRPDFSRLSRAVTGAEIRDVCRIAKRVVIHLSTGDSLVIEPRMTGLVLIADPPTTAHLRLVLTLAESGSGPSVGSRLLFWDRRGLGTVSLLTPEGLTELQKRLGPDPLTMDSEQWRVALRSTSRAIKTALLDQHRIAGIGNLYASEILHQARVSPFIAADRIGSQRVRRIAECAREILLTAIRYEGSTLNDGTYRNALNRDGSYQNQHRVYSREGLQCPVCERGSIRRVVQAQRSTFYCPVCQKR